MDAKPACWLRPFTPPKKERACEGRMDRAHLIAQQALRKNGHVEACADLRSWVPACRLHHTWFDNYILCVPRFALPLAVEELAREIGMEWWLDRRYGPVE